MKGRFVDFLLANVCERFAVVTIVGLHATDFSSSGHVLILTLTAPHWSLISYMPLGQNTIVVVIMILGRRLGESSSTLDSDESQIV